MEIFYTREEGGEIKRYTGEITASKEEIWDQLFDNNMFNRTTLDNPNIGKVNSVFFAENGKVERIYDACLKTWREEKYSVNLDLSHIK